MSIDLLHIFFDTLFGTEVINGFLARYAGAIIIDESVGTINTLSREICKYDLIATGHFLQH